MRSSGNINNWLSLTGFVLVINSLLLIVVLFLFSLLAKESNSYLGLYIYIILPVFLVLGLLLIPIGIWVRIRRKDAAHSRGIEWPTLDLNERKQRGTLLKIIVITVLIMVTSAIGSYKAYLITESVEFCGKVCHRVMEPQYTTYLNSPHARVKCVECHVGEGADWFVKSKLSGLYQIYSVLTDKFPRPIATPIHNLRPVRETCERCHWPEQFYANKLLTRRTYLSDSLNTEWQNTLVLKIGSDDESGNRAQGIHWHINKNFRIEYVATTPDRETIPWVKLTNLLTGEVKIFRDENNPVPGPGPEKLETRKMDCMDCHNRASHRFISPPKYIDKAIAAGKIPGDLPFIKKAAIHALNEDFPSVDSAMSSISQSILEFYKVRYPALYLKESKRIKSAITILQAEYLKNTFPYMRADATKYPDHIGHLESDGCFRCHSGRHKTGSGETISRNCDFCHVISAQGPAGKIAEGFLRGSLEYQHPTDIKGKWKTAFCSECHRKLYD